MKIDVMVAALATRQYGVASTRQIRELGGNDQFIRRRVADGRWVRLTSRVIGIVGAPASPKQNLMVSVLHAGPEALASHESAGWLWQIPGFAATGAVLRGRSHGATAAEGHRPTLVLPSHRTVVRGIPATTLPRTIFDLAAMLSLGRLARVIDTVVSRSPAMLPALHHLLPELSCKGRTGIGNMRTLLDERPIGSGIPPTGLEKQFEKICHNAGIRGLERQIDLGGHSWLGRVDYVRRDLKLIIEVDSEIHHTSLTDKANDAARDAAFLAAGWAAILRIGEEDIWYRPWFVVAELRRVLQELGAVV